MRLALLFVVLASCGGDPKHAQPLDDMMEPARGPLPAASTLCYAGISEGMGEQARTVAKRTVDPAAGTITEDVSNDAQGSHGAHTYHVVMTISDGDFTMKETGGAFEGTGTLSGEVWKWTSWESVSTLPNAPIVVTSKDSLEGDLLITNKEIKQGGKLLATTHEELKEFDCAKYDEAVAALAVPPSDGTTCEAACKNYATLKGRAAGKSQADIDAAITANVAGCVEQCVGAGNGTQTSCLAAATTVAALDACNQ